jgi:hypothetical protein
MREKNDYLKNVVTNLMDLVGLNTVNNIEEIVKNFTNYSLLKKIEKFIEGQRKFSSDKLDDDLLFLILNVINNASSLKKIDYLRKISIYYNNSNNLSKEMFERLILIIDKITIIEELKKLKEYEESNYFSENTEILLSLGLIISESNNIYNGHSLCKMSETGKLLNQIIKN